MRIASPLKPQFAKRVPWLFVFFGRFSAAEGLSPNISGPK
jgi:hypothetical protein